MVAARYDTLVMGGGMAGVPMAPGAARHGRVAPWSGQDREDLRQSWLHPDQDDDRLGHSFADEADQTETERAWQSWLTQLFA
jgi:hypothetical protein